MPDPFFRPGLKEDLMRMSPGRFWAMVLLIWFLTQLPYLNVPFSFLATWVHEMGHGIGALITGGRFESFLIQADFSGLAMTRVDGKFSEAVTVLMGLLGPSIIGGIMLVMTRGFNLGRVALCFISVGLLLTAILWADNMFTRIIVISLGIGIGAICGWGSHFTNLLAAYVVSITLCLNAISHITYYFLRSGSVGGQNYRSDTGVLTDIMGGPHIFWALMVTLFSVLILFISFKISGVLGTRQKGFK